MGEGQKYIPPSKDVEKGLSAQEKKQRLYLLAIINTLVPGPGTGTFITK
jgi:hypothetical protein